MISHNTGRLGKNLWSDLGEGEKIHVAELEDEHAEARFVAGEIEELIDQHGMSRDEIAVFYRTNAHSRVLEDILVRYELPYQVIGGTKFYERAEIKDAIAYLQLMVNPADEVSFSRVINSPRRGIGDTSQGRLRNHANTTGRTIWEIALEPEAVPGLGAAAIRSVSRFTELIEELARRVREWPRRRPAEGAAGALRLPRRAAGRAHDRGGGPDREPRGAGGCRRGVRRQPAGGGALRARAARGVPPGDLAVHRPGRPEARRVQGHADDPPQRQGPRVRRRLHHRLRGGRLPSLPLARGGQRGGGAPPRLCRDHPGAEAALDDPRPQPPDVRRARDGLPVALPLRAAR